MRKFLSLIVPVLFVLIPTMLASWGFYGHRKINRLGIFSLPEPMYAFYRENIDFISEHAVDPDKRRYSMVGEAERHYIDIDHYCHDPKCDPFSVVPKRWNDAVAQLSEDTLRAYGIVPWHLEWITRDLTEAFRQMNKGRILRLSAELGHYAGDASVPLHTTENYNGQMTNQYGIHGFWESRLPELLDENYDLFIGPAEYEDDVLGRAWETVMASHLGVDSVLRFERELSLEYPEDSKYVYEERGAALIKTYSREFSEEYHRRLNHMVERRMRAAVKLIGDLWYTAWVDAGQPDLNKLLESPIDPEIQEEIVKEANQPIVPELKSRPHDNE